MDNAPSHPPDVEFSNVTVRFFPPNTTSHLQPLDQGVIRCFKAHYRRYVLEHLLRFIDEVQSTDDIVKRLTVLDAIGWIDMAWSKVSSTCIGNCFSKAGFLPGAGHDGDDELIDVDGGEVATLSEFLERYKAASSATDVVDGEEFIGFDDNVGTSEGLGKNADEIGDRIWDQYLHQQETVESDEESDVVVLEEEEIQRSPITDKEVSSALALLKEYCTQRQSDLYGKVFELESLFTSEYVARKLQNSRQASLDSFLK